MSLSLEVLPLASFLQLVQKYFWDNHWQKKNVMLILCGSIATFMIKRVIKSTALYGRITLEIQLRGLPPNEAAQFFGGKRSKEEVLNYLMVFGTSLMRAFHPDYLVVYGSRSQENQGYWDARRTREG